MFCWFATPLPPPTAPPPLPIFMKSNNTLSRSVAINPP